MVRPVKKTESIPQALVRSTWEKQQDQQQVDPPLDSSIQRGSKRQMYSTKALCNGGTNIFVA